MPALQKTRAVVDLIDVDSQKWFDYAVSVRGPEAWIYRTESRRLRRLEKQLSSWAAAAFVVTREEADVFRSFHDWDGLQVLPNGVDFNYFKPPFPQPDGKGCIFVGALDYYPNVDAACWFCHEIWPEIYRRRPDSRLKLVGRRPVDAVRKLAKVPGVDVVGPVADVRPCLAKAAVAIAPLRIARGIQNKVLEALAMAKATVASPVALTGLPDHSDVPALCASAPAEWIDVVVRLLGDAGLRSQLGNAGRRYVKSHHDWDRCLAPLDDWLELPTRSAQLLAN
jgi:sugar transferase (PEP-CTERM/EpsH1 system associated)